MPSTCISRLQTAGGKKKVTYETLRAGHFGVCGRQYLSFSRPWKVSPSDGNAGEMRSFKGKPLGNGGRKQPPSLAAFKRYLGECSTSMLSDAIAFSASIQGIAEQLKRQPNATLIQRSAVGLENDTRLSGQRAPRLILTSPPYPGVHILYHRWQIEGRRETPAPFWIANRLDGSGESYYTLGHRRHPGLKTYFDNLQASFASIAALADNDTVFVQVVAFSDPTWQLPRYLAALSASGIAERLLPGLDTSDGRLWRRVPGRRWYADQRGPTAAAHEVGYFFNLTLKRLLQQ